MSTVLPPPRTPPRYSLYNSAVRPTGEASVRLHPDITYRAEACDIGGVFDTCYAAESGDPGLKQITLGDNEASEKFTPFIVWTGAICQHGSNERVRELPAEAERGLIARRSHYIAREFELGALQALRPAALRNRYLADGGATSVGTSLDPVDALACLEYELGRCGIGDGMIHAPRDVVTLWISANLLETNGRVVNTKLGSIVVPDTGYTGSGAGAGQRRVYGTGLVTLRITPEIEVLPKRLTDATDLEKNIVRYRAEQAAVPSFDPCCHLSVDVAVPDCIPVS